MSKNAPYEVKKRFYLADNFNWNGSKGRARGMKRMRQMYNDADFMRQYLDEGHADTLRDIELARSGDEKAHVRMTVHRMMLGHSCRYASPEVHALLEQHEIKERAVVDNYFNSKL